MGWYPCVVPEEWPRSPHQSSRKHPLLRLAEAKRLLLVHSQFPPQVLRVQKAISQHSELSSSAKGLTPCHLTSQRLGMSSSWQLVYWTSTQAVQMAFVLALTRVFCPYPRPLPSLITHLLKHIIEFNTTIQTEFQKEHYVGPVTQEEVELLIGPFQTSLLSIIPKPGRPGKF